MSNPEQVMTKEEMLSKLEEVEGICAVLMIALRRDNPFSFNVPLNKDLVIRAEYLLWQVREHLNKGGKQ